MSEMIERIISTAGRFSYRMNAVFVIDPDKLSAFRKALEDGQKRAAPLQRQR